MNASLKVLPRQLYGAHQDRIELQTRECLQFIDLTEPVDSIVRASGIRHGLVNIQSLHTTTGVVVNEHEPLLLHDLQRALERAAPRHRKYKHDDFAIRTVNMTDDERPNGHAHCKALFVPTSVALNVASGRMQLGRWQRIFLLELDRARRRTVSVLVFGL